MENTICTLLCRGRLNGYHENRSLQVQRPFDRERNHRSALEDRLEIVVVIPVQTPKHHRLRAASPSTLHVAIFPAAVRLDRQAAVGPQLSLSAKPIGGLKDGHSKRGPDRPEAWNLAQQLRGPMFLALGQKIPPHSWA